MFVRIVTTKSCMHFIHLVIIWIFLFVLTFYHAGFHSVFVFLIFFIYIPKLQKGGGNIALVLIFFPPNIPSLTNSWVKGKKLKEAKLLKKKRTEMK